MIRVYFAELRGATSSSGRCRGGVGRADGRRDHPACPRTCDRWTVPALRQFLAAGPRPVSAAVVGCGGQRSLGGGRVTGAPVPVPQRRVRGRDVRRTGHRSDQPTCPLHPPAARDADQHRGGPGRAAGRPGSRLAAALGVPVAKDTLLRLLRALPEEPVEPVRVLGVDDFALRKGD